MDYMDQSGPSGLMWTETKLDQCQPNCKEMDWMNQSRPKWIEWTKVYQNGPKYYTKSVTIINVTLKFLDII